MRILHIIPSYLPATYASGPIKPTHNLNKELVKKGVEVVVYTMNLDKGNKLNVPLEKEIDLDGVKIYHFPMSFKPWQYSYKLHRALARNIKNFDLVHITSVFLSVSTLGAYYAKKSNKPYIISLHGSLMSEPLKKYSLKKRIYINLFEKRNLKNASAIHFVIKQEKEEYLKTGLPYKKKIIIPNSLDFEEFKIKPAISFRKKFNIPEDEKIILFLGRLHWIKGLNTLVPAFADVVKKYSATLVLAGPNGGYLNKIKKMIRKNNLEKKVLIIGPVWDKEKNSVLGESNIFVLPSYTEALSVATLEAMFFNLPVITTKNSGLAEVIAENKSGIVVKKDKTQLTEAILKILNNPDLGKEMGKRGNKLVENFFSPSVVADKFLNLYKELK